MKQLGEQAGLPVFQPPSLKDDATQKQLAALDADVMIVVAYGLILPQAVLDTPRFGCLNVHASLLPRWRGAAPIQRAIEAGDTRTGLTIMQMDAGLDTGPMLAVVNCPIGVHTNAAKLQDELALLGPALLLEVLEDLPARLRGGRTQDNALANYAHKILKPEAHINWGNSAAVLDRQIRAFNPFPISFSMLGGERIRIWEAKPQPVDAVPEAPGTIIQAGEAGIVVSCNEGALALEVLQLEGGRALTAKDLLSAHQAKFAIGKRFDLPAVSAN